MKKKTIFIVCLVFLLLFCVLTAYLISSKKTSIPTNDYPKEIKEAEDENKERVNEEKENIYQALVEDLLNNTKISKEGDSFLLRYSHKQVQESYHLNLSLEVISKTGNVDFRYKSDDGWLSDSALYDPSGKEKEINLKLKSLDGKKVVLTAKSGDGKMQKTACIYQLLLDYDESYSLTRIIPNEDGTNKVDLLTKDTDENEFFRVFSWRL